MKMSDWLLNHYKKKFGEFEVLEHVGGSTWNDDGSWYSTVIKTKDGILNVHMASDYGQDQLIITKMKAVMKEVYVPE